MLSRDLLALSVIGATTTLMVGGCGATPATDAEESIGTASFALTESVYLSLPPGVPVEDVALGLTGPGYLSLNDRASIQPGQAFIRSQHADHYAVNSPRASQIVAPFPSGRTVVGYNAVAQQVTSVPDVFLRGWATAKSVTTGGAVEYQEPRNISAAAIREHVPGLDAAVKARIDIEVPAAGTDELNIQPDAKDPVVLTPGGHGRVSVARGSTLVLGAGAYRLASLILEPGSKLKLDNHAGKLQISIDNEFIVRGTMAPSAPQRGNLLFYYRGQSMPAIDSNFVGTLLAPRAPLMLPSKRVHTGSFFARSIEVHQDGVVRHIPYTPEATATCGVLGQSCCGHDWCGAGARCDQGTCRADRCGWSGEPCCAGNTCGTGLTCYVPEPVPCDDDPLWDSPFGDGFPGMDDCEIANAIAAGRHEPNTCVGEESAAPPTTYLTLPESIFVNADITEDVPRDQDKDWLKDDLENRLAEALRPYFVFDEQENDFSSTVNDYSLQSWEPRTLFQVHPVDCPSSGCNTDLAKIRVKYLFLFRLDGGFRGDNVCFDWHYGDSQSGDIEIAVRGGGRSLEITSLNMFHGGARTPLDPDVRTVPGYASFGSNRHPVIYMSAGKHHQYPNGAACEGFDDFCDDDCGGGFGYDLNDWGRGSGPRYADLRPLDAGWSEFTNVGEQFRHQAPHFINDLSWLGYPNEEVWTPRWTCTSVDGETVAKSLVVPFATSDINSCFTGGTGTAWDCHWLGCTIPGPVNDMVSPTTWPAPPY